jgi:hypothetical protein
LILTVSEINRRQVKNKSRMEEKSEVRVHAIATNQKTQESGRNQGGVERQPQENGWFVLKK